MAKRQVKYALMLSACLGIAGLSVLIPGLAFAQSTPATTTAQSSELAEAERLNQQAFKLYQPKI